MYTSNSPRRRLTTVVSATVGLLALALDPDALGFDRRPRQLQGQVGGEARLQPAVDAGLLADHQQDVAALADRAGDGRRAVDEVEHDVVADGRRRDLGEHVRAVLPREPLQPLDLGGLRLTHGWPPARACARARAPSSRSDAGPR